MSAVADGRRWAQRMRYETNAQQAKGKTMQHTKDTNAAPSRRAVGSAGVHCPEQRCELQHGDPHQRNPLPHLHTNAPAPHAQPHRTDARRGTSLLPPGRWGARGARLGVGCGGTPPAYKALRKASNPAVGQCEESEKGVTILAYIEHRSNNKVKSKRRGGAP